MFLVDNIKKEDVLKAVADYQGIDSNMLKLTKYSEREHPYLEYILTAYSPEVRENHIFFVQNIYPGDMLHGVYLEDIRRLYIL